MANTLFVALAALLCAAVTAVPYVGKISVSEVGPLTMYSGMNRTLVFTLSQPVICVNQTLRKCGVVVLITNTNPRDVYISNCAVKWGKEDWWQPRYISVIVKPGFVDRVQQTVTLITNAPITDAPFYNTTDADPADITLITQTRPSRWCSGVGDPHYSTFDNFGWHFFDPSQQVFYGSSDPNRIFEAQTRTENAPTWLPAWHCGLAVREGNGVAYVNKCGGTVTMDVRGTGVTLRSIASGFEFTTTGGSVLTFTGADIVALAPGTDYMQTYGMCGNNNGNPNDDAPIGSGGVVYNVNNLFPSQRMNGRIDLFNWRPTSSDVPPPQPRLDCNYTNEPLPPPIIIAPIVDISDLLRNHSSDNVTPPPFIIPTQANGPTSTHISSTDARVDCTSQINASPMVAACVAALGLDITDDIDNCVRDFVADSPDPMWVISAVLGIQQRCAIIADTTGRLDDSNLANAFCPTANTQICSGHGDCVNRTCVCDRTHSSGDCSIDLSQPPTLRGIQDNLCDAIGHLSCPEHTIIVDGTNFLNSPSLTCLFGSVVSPAQFLSPTTVMCALPHPVFTGFPELRIRVKVSNDGTVFSNSVDMIYYDSSCQVCNSTTCRANPNSCVVNNVCYVNNQGSPDNACLVCNTNISSSTFSFDYSHSVCQPVFRQNTYPVRIVGGGYAGQTLVQVNAVNPLVAADTANTLTYSLETASPYFQVNASGWVTVKQDFSITYNFSASVRPMLTVVATDAYGHSSQATLLFEFLETAVPAIFSQDEYNATINENTAVGTRLVQLTAVAQGGAVTYSWYVQPASFAGAAVINATNGWVSVGMLIDFEAIPVGHDGRRMLTFTAKALSSNGQSALVGFHLYILNVNENPTAVTLTGTSVNENAPANTLVGLLSTVDPDLDTQFTYTITAPTTSPFKIVGNQLMTTGAAIDYETLPTHQFTLTIRSVDAGNLFVSSQFVITVVNVNEAPFDIRAVGNLSIPETTAVNSPIDVVFSAQDPENDAVECGLMGVSADDMMFLIFNNRLILAGALDYRVRTNYTISVLCADRGTPSQLSQPQSFVIQVLRMPLPPQLAPVPIILAPSFQEVDPNAGSVTVPPTPFFQPGSGGSGQSSSSSTTTASGDVTGPTTTTTTTPTRVPGVPENVPVGTIIGAVQAVDPEANGGNFTFAIAPEHVPYFAIVNTTCLPPSPSGAVSCSALIQTISPVAFDFENPQAHEIHVLVTTQAGARSRLVVPVNVINENDAPTAPIWADTDPFFIPGQVQENSPAGTYIGTLQAQDQDQDQTISMQVVSPAGDFFRITPQPADAVLGRRDTSSSSSSSTPSRLSTVRLGAEAVLDYETQPFVTLVLNVSDNGVPMKWTLITLNISVSDQPMTPLLNGRATDTTATTWNLPENSELVGDLTVSGLDRQDLTEVFSLTDSQDGVFSVVKLPNSNQWQLRAQSMDFETAQKKVFFVGLELSFWRGTVQAQDIAPIQRTVRVALVNVDEPPVFFLVNTTNVFASTTAGIAAAGAAPTLVNTDTSLFHVVFNAARAVDPDGDNVTYTLTDSLNKFVAGSRNGEISTADSLDNVPLVGHSRNVSLVLIAQSQAAGQPIKSTSVPIVLTLHDDCFRVDCASLNQPGPCTDLTQSEGKRNTFSCIPISQLGVTPDASKDSSSSSNSSASTGMIAGVAVGVAVLVAALAFLALVVFRRRQNPTMMVDMKLAAEKAAGTSVESSLMNPMYGQGQGQGQGQGMLDGASNPLYKWYMPNMSRADAEDFLLDAEDGSFVVRDSTATPGWHMIAVKTRDSIVHEKIKMSEDGMYELLPASNRKQPKFTALPDLIEHYAKPQDGVKFALYVDNPLYDNSQLMERKAGHAVPVAWTVDNDPSAPIVPLKERERQAVRQIATISEEDSDMYCNTAQARSALGNTDV